jgi:hypothetical protein
MIWFKELVNMLMHCSLYPSTEPLPRKSGALTVKLRAYGRTSVRSWQLLALCIVIRLEMHAHSQVLVVARLRWVLRHNVDQIHLVYRPSKSIIQRKMIMLLMKNLRTLEIAGKSLQRPEAML